MKKNVPYLVVINIILLLCFFVTISCATVKQGDLEEPALGHNEMLQELGIVTNLGGLTDPEGNPLPDDYNPLGKNAEYSAPSKRSTLQAIITTREDLNTSSTTPKLVSEAFTLLEPMIHG